MTLWELSKNTQAYIDDVNPILNTQLRTRLSEMGFSTGEVLKCMKRSPFNGPIVIQIQDCVYSLDKQLAQSIFIRT